MARLVVSIIAMGIVALPGCSRGSGGAATDSVDPTWERLLTLGRAYKQFNSESRKPPKRASDLRPILKALGVGEETFSSQRDGQPFVICWGVDVTVPAQWAKSRPILAYERQGQLESRYVLTTFANIELLSRKQFMESSFPPGYKPAE